MVVSSTRRPTAYELLVPAAEFVVRKGWTDMPVTTTLPDFYVLDGCPLQHCASRGIPR
jgi:hypothetical protein